MPEDKPRQDELSSELRELRQAITKLNNQNFMRMHSTWPRFIAMSLVRGLLIGFGSVIGATVLVYLLIEFLSNINFIPVIGKWASEIIVIMDQNSGTHY